LRYSLTAIGYGFPLLRLMQNLSGSVVFLQQRENFLVIQRIAIAADDGQQLRVCTQSLHGDMKFPRDLRREARLRHARLTAISFRGSGILNSLAASLIAGHGSSGPQADNRPPNGVRPTGRRSVVQTSRLQEGQQVCVDRFRLRGRHAVWEVLVGLERPVFQKLRRQRPGIRVRNDLIVLTVHHQHRYGDFL
jgi:hypothetical protein